MKRPWVLGITGGIASGKSQVTEILESHGALVIDADRIGHQVLEDHAVQTLLVRQFGQSVLSQEAKSVDRKRVAELVFGDTPQAIQRRRALEAITHPPIRARIRQQLDEALRSATLRWIVLDVPLLLESGWDKSCDAVWFVDAPQDIRLQRVLVRGWTREHFLAREASQWSVDRKRSRATHVISNSGSLEELDKQVTKMLQMRH
ncbi:MAG: dephospho-CoA kinase [Planctomycetota bacterium]